MTSDDRFLGWNRSKRFWLFFLVVWVVFGAFSLLLQLWWSAAVAALGILNTAIQWRKAPDQSSRN